MNNQVKELYISFLFPPSDFVSGINVFKRIVENKNSVDILQANVSSSDLHFDEMERYINNRIYVDVDCVDDSAICISKFINNSIDLIPKSYEKVYSRSWFSANHFLAFEYKTQNPNVFWTAEFSDPLIFDLTNNVKKYKKIIFDNPDYIEKINGNKYKKIKLQNK